MPAPADDDIPVADVLPAAVPIAAPRLPPPKAKSPTFPIPDPDSRPPKPRLFTACCAIGCLGGAAVAGVGFLLFVALVVLGQLGQQMADQNSNDPGASSRGQRPGPILKSRFSAGQTTLSIPNSATAIGLGGNGRYLLLRMRGSIAVFDPNAGEFATPFLFSNDDRTLAFAAGASRLFVFRNKRIERLNLETRQLEATSNEVFPPSALVVGSSSDGPLHAFTLRGRTTDVAVIDPDRLAETRRHTFPAALWTEAGGTDPRASGDGRLIGFGGTKPSLSGFLVRAVEDRFPLTALSIAESLTVGHVAPSPDGRFVYTSRGVFDTAGKPLAGLTGKSFYTLPAAHGGDFFLSLETNGAGIIRSKVRLHLSGERTPVGDFDSAVGPQGLSVDDIETVPADQRVHFWPAAGLLVVLTPQPAATKLDVYAVDVPAMLQASGRPYLAFGSDPSTVAIRGQEFRYRPEVWSSDGPNAEFELKRSPAGMHFNGTELIWTPDSHASDEAEVELQASSAFRTSTQKFRIVVNDP